MKQNKVFVMALGGSIICPEKINTRYLSRFYKLIKEYIKKGYYFIIVAGGGKIARDYQKAASRIVNVSDEDKDWLGIHATRLNAHLLRTVFRKEADPVVFDQRHKLKKFNNHSIIIASGWKPGWSTDFVAVQIAVDFKVKRVLILGKPKYVYTHNPEKHEIARPIKKITWEDYLKRIPKKWKPGLHLPVDPVASRLAKEKNIEVIVASAKDLKNLTNILEGKSFKGTLIY
jgi:uridylate kinase